MERQRIFCHVREEEHGNHKSVLHFAHSPERERDGNKSLVHSEKELGNITPFSKLDSGTWARWVGRGYKSTEVAVHP